MSEPDHHRHDARLGQNTKSCSQSVREFHELYFASLSAKKYGRPYFSARKRIQNIPEAAPKAPPASNAQSGFAFNGVSIILYNYTSGIAPGFAYRLLAEGLHRSLMRGQIPRCSRRTPLKR
jgi:hypothetical protein